jgi:calcineurin-like phosphoesterase
LRIPYVSLAGLTSIIDFHAEATAEAKMLVLEKMFDNSMLQEIEKEMTSKRQRS